MSVYWISNMSVRYKPSSPAFLIQSPLRLKANIPDYRSCLLPPLWLVKPFTDPTEAP